MERTLEPIIIYYYSFFVEIMISLNLKTLYESRNVIFEIIVFESEIKSFRVERQYTLGGGGGGAERALSNDTKISVHILYAIPMFTNTKIMYFYFFTALSTSVYKTHFVSYYVGFIKILLDK